MPIPDAEALSSAVPGGKCLLVLHSLLHPGQAASGRGCRCEQSSEAAGRGPKQGPGWGWGADLHAGLGPKLWTGDVKKMCHFCSHIFKRDRPPPGPQRPVVGPRSGKRVCVPHAHPYVFTHARPICTLRQAAISDTRARAHLCPFPCTFTGEMGRGSPLHTIRDPMCTWNSWHIICFPSPRLLGSFPDAVLWSFLSPSRALGRTEVVSPD